MLEVNIIKKERIDNSCLAYALSLLILSQMALMCCLNWQITNGKFKTQQQLKHNYAHVRHHLLQLITHAHTQVQKQL